MLVSNMMISSCWSLGFFLDGTRSLSSFLCYKTLEISTIMKSQDSFTAQASSAGLDVA